MVRVFNNTVIECQNVLRDIRIFKFLGEAVDAIKASQKQSHVKKTSFPLRYESNGRLFERWCAKTLIDFVCVEKGNTIWHGTTKPVLDPPVDVVRAIYGLTKFEDPMGLYLAQENTDRPQDVLREVLTVDPRFHPKSGGLVGAFLGFRDFRFLIWLTIEPFELFSTETSGGVPFGASGNKVHYHPDALKIAVNGVVRYKVVFDWT